MNLHLKKMLKRLSSGKHMPHEMNAFRDWKIIVVCTMLLNIAVVGWSMYLFWMVYSESIYVRPEGSTDQKIEKLNEKGLEALVQKFEERSTYIQASTTPITDPSI